MRSARRGFILLELIVALTILGLGFSILFAGMSNSERNIERLDKAQSRQAHIRNLIAKLDLIQQFSPGESAQGTFEDGFRWRVDVSPFASAPGATQSNVVRIDLRLEWEGRSGVQRKAIETYRFVSNPSLDAHSLGDQLLAIE
jgi:prepilin-type N-terminal cleavage/methylation domain-containing protein